jgi:hypothetical protein
MKALSSKVAAGLFISCALSGCKRETPYEIFDRTEEQGGLVVAMRVGVPDQPTTAQLQGWCDEITQSEGGKIVNINFVDKSLVGQQRGLCAGGKAYSIGDLHRTFRETPNSSSTP